jgi:hypothetical protein
MKLHLSVGLVLGLGFLSLTACAPFNEAGYGYNGGYVAGYDGHDNSGYGSRCFSLPVGFSASSTSAQQPNWLVTSPYPPYAKVNTQGVPHGTAVRDPATGKLFIKP